VRIDRAALDLARVAPHLLEQLGARCDLSAPLEQRDQQIVLFRSKRHRVAGTAYGVRARIDLDLTERHGRRELVLRPGGRRASQQRVNARQELE
jgi:hypothetical protein